MISVIMINSRGKAHPDWLDIARNSVKNQMVEVELVEIENLDRLKTIGKCWNEGVRKAKYDYVLFLGDDDYLSNDYCSTLISYALNTPNFVMWTTFMTAYDDEDKLYAPIQTPCTGMWRKDYILKYPFNEELKTGIDREYFEEMKKRGDKGFSLRHHFGYYYRKHSDYSCAGNIIFKETPSDIYVLAGSRNFIDPLVQEWRKDRTVFVSSKFNPDMADKAKVIFCEWASENAEKVSRHECKAKKILRLHSYEAFSPMIHYIEFNAFDLVIFIAEHIKDYVEEQVGKIKNAVVIPVGIDLEKYPFIERKKNNKICYAGEISRKKGIGELFLLAKELPEYEFHVAGKFKEDDVARFFQKRCPMNVFLHPYSYNLNEFFKDKTFIINTSLREGNPVTTLEGMATGLKPLVYDWVGSEIYGKYVFKNIKELKELLNEFNPKEYREFAEQFDLNKTKELINEYVQS